VGEDLGAGSLPNGDHGRSPELDQPVEQNWEAFLAVVRPLSEVGMVRKLGTVLGQVEGLLVAVDREVA
jgi:hypothetical protein